MDLLIDKTMTVQALKRRRYQPMLMIDLAVPRDIDSSISRIDDIYLILLMTYSMSLLAISSSVAKQPSMLNCW